jgi:hypothetical protein
MRGGAPAHESKMLNGGVAFAFATNKAASALEAGRGGGGVRTDGRTDGPVELAGEIIGGLFLHGNGRESRLLWRLKGAGQLP